MVNLIPKKVKRLDWLGVNRLNRIIKVYVKSEKDKKCSIIIECRVG